MSVFKPTRVKAEEEKLKDFEIVANLDDIISKRIAFVLHGKTHYIKVITTKEFLQLSNALAGLWTLQERSGVEAKEVLKAFFETIHSVCDSITLEDVEKCTQMQIAGIFNLVMSHCMGKADLDQGKKKAMMGLASHRSSLN